MVVGQVTNAAGSQDANGCVQRFKIGDRVRKIDGALQRGELGNVTAFYHDEIIEVAYDREPGNPWATKSSYFELVATASPSGSGQPIPLDSGALCGGTTQQAWIVPDVPGTYYGEGIVSQIQRAERSCNCNSPKVWYQPFRGERIQVCEKCGKE